ncbi:MAG: PQQ-dependent sugar dehydrogenase [Pseudomonadota bacterium]
MLRLICAIALLGVVGSGPAWAERLETSAGLVEVVPVVEDLDTPWAVAFLPDGGFLITERDGTLLRISPDGARAQVSGVPDVRASGQGGLLDVVLDPGFAENNLIYLSYSEPEGFRSARTVVAKARLTGTVLEGLEVIFRMEPATSGGRHFGSRIVPDGEGHLFITTGDRGSSDEAQNPNTHIGKVIRIRDDGSVPADNPFSNGAALPEIWSIGHRNPQGAALDAEGNLWTVSHGARGGDEINQPQSGRNYGWPIISYGTTYGGTKIGEGTAKPGMEQPVFYWDPSIAPSGMMIYSGKLWPAWAGHIFVGSLKFDLITRLERDGGQISGEEHLFRDRFTRIRDVREGPEGAIWFLSVGDGALYRMRPAP